MTDKAKTSRRKGNGPAGASVADIMSVIEKLEEMRGVKKDLTDYTDENSYFSRAFHRCFELGPFIVPGSEGDRTGTFFSSAEIGPVVTRSGALDGKYAICLKRFIVSDDKLRESPEKLKPGDAVIWKMYFRNLEYPSVLSGSNISIPEIIAAWDKFKPIIAEILDMETRNLDTVIKTIKELEGYLAADMLSDYATDNKPGV